jgi:hypothetical protein
MKSFALVALIAPVVAALALLRIIGFDAAMATIQSLFVVSLVSGIVENYQKKKGWSVDSALLTGSSLISLGLLFFYLGLLFTGTMTVLNGIFWLVILGQTVKYEKVD